MDWILDHLQLIIIIGSSIAWWLTQQRKEDEDETPKPGERPGRQRIDWQREQERDGDAARQVRERMRQLREQRGQGGAPTEAPAPRRAEPTVQDLPPVLRELMGIPDKQPEPEPAPAPPPLPPRESSTDRMSRQLRELEAKQREAEAMAAKARRGMPSRSRTRRPAAAKVALAKDPLAQPDFLETLRDPRSARRAILLKEVLDRPVSLR